MGYVLVIAFVLACLFGFSAGANFVAVVVLGGFVAACLGNTIKAVTELLKFQIVSAVLHALAAVGWGLLLSICL